MTLKTRSIAGLLITTFIVGFIGFLPNDSFATPSLLTPEESTLRLGGAESAAGATNAELEELMTAGTENTDTASTVAAMERENSSAASSFSSPAVQQRVDNIETQDQHEPDKATDVKEIVTKVAQVWQYVLNVFNPLIAFFTFYIGALLNNDFIFAGNMGEMLQNLWRVNRNLVNIIFVLILLYLALKHIFSEGEGGTDLKKTLPLFALMLIAVNFSWLAGKVVLDAANVATNVVFAIPSAVQSMVGSEKMTNEILKEECGVDNTNKVGRQCVTSGVYRVLGAKHTLNLTEEECKSESIEQKLDETHASEANENANANNLGGFSVFCWKKINFADYNQNSASYFLTYSMGRVQDLTRTSNKGILKAAFGGIFSLVLQIVYLITFASVFLALIFRIAILWFFMAFSPLLVLLYVIRKNLPELKVAESGTLSMETFSQWAFAPAKVAAVWSVGFIMVTVGQAASKDLPAATAVEQVGKMYKIDSLFMGMDNISQFVWLLMTIGIIWMGTFAILKDLKIAGELFGRINTWGTNIARLVAQSPTWAPILPIYDSKT
ncbi:MAG: hypothetical protein V1908_01840, partial [Candidatus Peregrinibacteria bacterium]